MKSLLLLQIFFTISLASLIDISSFEANFTQVITDDKKKELTYYGHIQATNSQYALWDYIKPVKKSIYITPDKITIIEPEIEQVIIRKLSSDFDFFKMIKNAKKISDTMYVTFIKNSKYTILIKDDNISSIFYIDEFDNKVEIFFANQVQNKVINKETFYPIIPKEYDIIKE